MSLVNFTKRVVKKILGIKPHVPTKEEIIHKYISAGRVPWAEGYSVYKWDFISKSIINEALLSEFADSRKPLPKGFGLKLDDRAVEYPWIFSNIRKGKSRFL